MEALLYLLFGFLDVFLILTFIFKIFRWPMFSYLREIVIISVICSAESYLTRMVFHISEYDTVIQVLTIMLMLRYLIKVNFYHALILSVIGVMAYSEVVFSVYQLLGALGIVSSDEATSTSGLGIYTLQFYSEISGIVLAFAFYKLNLGFSFVSIPPHDRKSKYSNNEKVNLIFYFLAVVILFSATYWFNTYGGYGINMIMITEFIALLILLYFARKREYNL